MFGDILGSCESKTGVATFWATFGQTWAIFIPTSAHTEWNQVTMLI